MTTCSVSPVRVAPDCETLLDTMTAMYVGSVGGGLPLLPGSPVQSTPQTGRAFEFSKPRNWAGVDPPLSVFVLLQRALQKVTPVPIVGEGDPALLSPTTKATPVA